MEKIVRLQRAYHAALDACETARRTFELEPTAANGERHVQAIWDRNTARHVFMAEAKATK